MLDEQLMKTVFALAVKGKGKVSPNPLVGAIVVKNNLIAGKGYHKSFGSEHAEVNAIKEAGNRSRGANLYCNLEPCSHQGKTPPCTDLIIRSGIKKVIISTKDPNPLVNGNGIKILADNEIEILNGVLETEGRQLNRFFIKHISSGMPYVTLKIGQTLNGKINSSKNKKIQITGEKAQKYVHKLRTEYDAVLIGKNTALIDNPILTTRLVKGRTPDRIIVDTNLESDITFKIFNTLDKGKVKIITASENSEKIKIFKDKGVDILIISTDDYGRIDLKKALKKLGKSGISSVLVEGGAKVITDFFAKKLVDNVILHIAPLFFRKGLNIIEDWALDKNIKLENIKSRMLGDNLMIEGTPIYIRD